jgi:hypothetical protein
VNQSSGHMEDPKPESPSKKQNDRQGDEHNPFLQLRMTATHRKVGGPASQPCRAEPPPERRALPPTHLMRQDYAESQRGEIDRPA